ncbi:SpoIIE family protein phosphatase [Caldicellulosiruptoraceae bacterium PP1]
MEKVEVLTFKRHQAKQEKVITYEILKKEDYLILFLSFLFGRCNILEFSPLCLSLLASFKKKNYLFYLSALFSIFGVMSTLDKNIIIKYVLSICIITVIFYFFNFNTYYNSIITFGSLFFSSCISCFILQKQSAYLLYCFFEAVIAAGMVFAFEIFQDTLYKRKSIKSEKVFLFIIILSISLFGLENIFDRFFEIKKLLLMLIICIIAYNYGILFSTTLGFITGFIDVIKTSSFVENAVIYSFTALMAGLFKGFGKVGTCIGALFGYLLSTIYISTFPNIKLREIIASCIIFLVFPIEKIKFNMDEVDNMDIQVALKQKMQSISSIIDNIKKNEIESMNLLINKDEAKKMIEDVCSRLCYDCIYSQNCWENDYKTTNQMLKEIREILMKKGKVNFSSNLQIYHNCVRSKEFITILNGFADSFKYSMLIQNNLAQKEKGMFKQIDVIKEILIDAAKLEEENVTVDKGLSSELEIELNRFGYNVKSAQVTFIDSDFYCNIILEESFKTPKKSEIEAIAKTICGYEVEIISEIPNFDGTYEITLIKKPNIWVDYAISSKSKKMVNGDRVCFLQLKDGKFISCISDGMGTGKEASENSFIVIDALKKLTNLGFNKEIALKFINSVLNIRSKEGFASVDIVSIDRYKKRLEIYKMGAMPTFIKRGPNVFIYNSSSLPAGVDFNNTYDYFIEDIEKGDMIFMVSDGVIESLGESGEHKLLDYLRENSFSSTQFATREILNFALETTQKIIDDMTVVSLKIG